MVNPKNGHDIPCAGGCGKLVYVKGSYIERKIRKTCGGPLCRSTIMSGKNNPFWGRKHDDENRTKIREGLQRRGKIAGTGPKKGVFKQSPEARAKMSEALRQRWKHRRQFMLDNLPRGEDHHMKGIFPEPRYRKHFTALMKREWMGSKCFWCDATEQLTLDHVIPVMCGGLNVKENSQTLCQPCNLWKMIYVDRPLMLAFRQQGGPKSTRHNA